MPRVIRAHCTGRVQRHFGPVRSTGASARPLEWMFPGSMQKTDRSRPDCEPLFAQEFVVPLAPEGPTTPRRPPPNLRPSYGNAPAASAAEALPRSTGVLLHGSPAFVGHRAPLPHEPHAFALRHAWV